VSGGPCRYAKGMSHMKKARITRHWKREVDRSYWTPEAVAARKEAKEKAREATLAKESQKQADIEYRSVPFHNDDEELAYLIAEQAKDLKYGNSNRWGKELALDNYLDGL